MSSYHVTIVDTDGKTKYRGVRCQDGPKDWTLSLTDWDILNGKQGNEAACALACAIFRERKILAPHPVLLVNVLKRTIYIVDKMDDSGRPIHCYRYLHYLDVHGKFDIVKDGKMEPQVVTIRVARGRDRLGHRVKTDYEKKSDAPVVPRKVHVARGIGARAVDQETWIHNFINKHGAPPRKQTGI